MLEQKFKHSTYFKGADMTVKQFLDYVLEHAGDWYIKAKPILSNDLLAIPINQYYLTCSDNGRLRGRYTLNDECIQYLSEHNQYFKSKFKA